MCSAACGTKPNLAKQGRIHSPGAHHSVHGSRTRPMGESRRAPSRATRFVADATLAGFRVAWPRQQPRQQPHVTAQATRFLKTSYWRHVSTSALPNVMCVLGSRSIEDPAASTQPRRPAPFPEARASALTSKYTHPHCKCSAASPGTLASREPHAACEGYHMNLGLP